MVKKSYHEMTEYELKQEIASLREKARKAEQLGIINEYAVYERKAQVAEAFLMDKDKFQPGEIYRIKGEPGEYFRVDYLRGIIAWGYRLNGDRGEEASPFPCWRSWTEGAKRKMIVYLNSGEASLF